ncbi:MAG: DUF3619 family protein [Burkholderiaceae bacterium]|nr:DUF3619 family protein [Burkholderiaceae bacterium]
MKPPQDYPPSASPATLENRFGLWVAARLSAGAQELPYEIAERLRAARVRAVARRKQPAPVRALRWRPGAWAQGNGRTAVLGFGGDDALDFWARLGSLAALTLLAAALVTIHMVQSDSRAADEAEVDTALLTDALPPQAYTDSGFLQFLKTASGQPATQTR